MGDKADRWLRALRDDLRFQGAQVSPIDGGVALTRGRASVRVVESEPLLGDAKALGGLLAQDRGLVLMGTLPGELAPLPAGAAIAVLASDASDEAVRLAVEGLLERIELRINASRFVYERGEIVEIARAMTQERDIDRLLDLILEKSRFITGADAGSIYVVETPEGGTGQRLRFKHSQNDSVRFESSEFVVPVNMQSIAGAAVLGRQAINIADVYVADADDSLPYGFDESFDERVGYRTVSMLTMPMISAEDEVIGVIQLINKKRNPRSVLETPEDCRREVIAFDERSEGLLTTLAAQAGIALENALLYDEIRKIFEGFVRASVQAIEQRDPTTSGHSQRVSTLSCRLAETLDGAQDGPFAHVHFSRRDLQELEYAALLHDFGKIGVREQVLVKAKKLYPAQHAEVRGRIDFAIKAEQAAALQRRVALMEQGGSAAELSQIDQRLAERIAELEGAWDLIDRANEPTVLHEGDFSRIAEIGAMQYADATGELRNLLSEDEVVALSIMRGSLSPREIDEIRSHVVHTYNFLIKIPWGKSMRRIPEIAGAHHEKLNGSGYPHGLHSAAIPLPSKIMTIADIYDALTARDRPYKKAMPTERALQILGFEVKDGNLDADLMQVFVDAGVYRATEND